MEHYIFTVVFVLLGLAALYAGIREEIRKVKEQRIEEIESMLWEKKRADVQKILEQHKKEVQDILDRTINKLTRAFESAMIKKAQMHTEGRSTLHRSIDD